MKKVVVILISLMCFSATAGPIVAVLAGANVPGYGASGFHDAGTAAGVMSGPSLATITHADGSYNSGTLDANLTWDHDIYGVKTGNLSGHLDFSITSGSIGELTLTFSELSLALGTGYSVVFDVMAGQQCCSGDFAPNSYIREDAGHSILTLWTAENTAYRGGLGKFMAPPPMGMDLQLRIADVPEPGTTFLLGTGLVLFGLRQLRKNKAAS